MSALMHQNKVNAICRRIDDAISSHAKLRLDNDRGDFTHIRCDRLGFSVHARIRLKQSRKGGLLIGASGDTADNAAIELIRQLDTWAEAMR